MRKIVFMLISIAMAATAIACSDSSVATQNNDLYLSVKNELAALPADYSTEDAVDDGCFVIVHGEVRSDRKIADDFISNAKKGTPGALRIVQYTVEGDPIITQVIFDGSVFHSILDASRDTFGVDTGQYEESEYPYLETYQFTQEETGDDYETVYLTLVALYTRHPAAAESLFQSF